MRPLWLASLLALVVSLTAAGCASMNVGHSGLNVENDCEFSGTVEVEGQPKQHAMGDFYFLRSFVACDTAYAEHQLYVEDNYDDADWRFYERARMSGGKALEFTEISQDVNCSGYGCTYEEHFAVELTEEILSQHRSDSLRVRIYAQDGTEKDLTVPPDLIREQLSAVDSVVTATSGG